jgi:putative transposase
MAAGEERFGRDHERPVMRVEHHLLALARIGADIQHPAVAEPDMRDLHPHGYAVSGAPPIAAAWSTTPSALPRPGSSRRSAASVTAQPVLGPAKPDPGDNALAETINGLYKAEVIHRRGPWRSFEAVEYATLEWVDWFNNRRLLEPIGNIPPAEAEER